MLKILLVVNAECGKVIDVRSFFLRRTTRELDF